MERSDSEKFDLILDVLRANKLHQEHCNVLASIRAWSEGQLVDGGACNCWLSEPPPPPRLPESELHFDISRRAFRVDRDDADTWPEVTVAHVPSGLVASAQHYSALQAKAECLAQLMEKVAAWRSSAG